MKGEDQTAFWE